MAKKSLPNPPAATAPWYTIRAAGADTAEVLIYGDIGESWFGESVTALQFVEELQALADKNLLVRINSFGGSVADGLAIYNAIRRHPLEKTVAIDGVAISIASLIAMAGDTVQMSENALMMIHDPWGGAVGNATVMREYADVLDTHARAMATSYASQTGQPVEDMLALITNNAAHWYTAEEAIAAGLVDEIIEVEGDAAAAAHQAAHYRAQAFSRFKAPAAIAAAYPNPSQEEITMPDITKPAAAAGAATPAAPVATEPTNVVQIEQAAEARTLARLAERNAAIDAVFAKFAHIEGVSALHRACLTDPAITAQQASEKLIAKLGENAAPIAGNMRVDLVQDASDKFRVGAREAIDIRAGRSKRPSTNGNEFISSSLVELAKHALRLNGKAVPMDRMEMVNAALHTTSDFPFLLADTANKSLMLGYEQADETYQLWTRKGNLSDFKVANRVGLSLFSSLDEIKEHGEYKMGTIAEGREQIQLLTYGKKFGVSRQAIINDDLGSFTDAPRKLGMAAHRKVGDLAYAVLTANGNMADGVALFHAATHKNLAGTGTVISVASLSASRTAMATQKDKNSNGPLNIRPTILLVPHAVSGVADATVASTSDPSQANPAKKNPEFGRWTVVMDARLDENSATAWYALAAAGIYDTVEVAFLDGNDMPTMEQQPGWDIDGIEWKVRIDAAAKALEWRTMYKNPGA